MLKGNSGTNRKIVLNILLMALGFCATGTLISVIHHPTAAEVSALAPLNELEASVWEKLTLLGCTKASCDAELNKRKKDIQVDALFKNLSDETKKLCLEITQEFGVNLSALSFYGAQMPSSAASWKNIIYIDEKKINQYSRKAKKYIIGHELIHFIYQDLLMDEIIMKKTGLTNSDSATCPLNEFRRFTEIRADILCAERGPDYAEGYLEYITYWIEKAPTQTPEPTHPSDEQRLVLAKQITSAFKSNIIRA